MILTQEQQLNRPIVAGYGSVGQASAPRRLRVLHLVSFLGCGGTEHGVLKVVRGLDGAHFEQRICVTRGFDPSFARQFSLEDKLYVAGRPELTLQFPLFRLARIMRSYRPDIVHSRNWGALEAVPAARLVGVPGVVHSEHGYELDGLAGLPRRQQWFRHAAYAMADAVFTVTDELRDYHARQAGIATQRIGVIPNGVDTEHFAPHPEVRRQLRSEIGLPTDAFVVGAVGRLARIKDPETLVRAAGQLGAGGINAWVLLVGAGPELEKLRRFSEESPWLTGRVIFTGSSDRVSDWLNSMDAFVLPSLGEGFSNTLLEAMACGLPSLATRVGGNPEVIGPEGTGWLFPPGDSAGLACLLERLERDPDLRRGLSTSFRQRAISEFSLECMLARYQDLYRDVAERRGFPCRREA